MNDQDIKAIRKVLPGHRRSFSDGEKRALLTEAFRKGESLSSLGRRYDIAVSLLFRWKRALKFDPEQAMAEPALQPPVQDTNTRSFESRLETLEFQVLLLSDENRRLQLRLRRLEKGGQVPDAQDPTSLKTSLRNQV